MIIGDRIIRKSGLSNMFLTAGTKGVIIKEDINNHYYIIWDDFDMDYIEKGTWTPKLFVELDISEYRDNKLKELGI